MQFFASAINTLQTLVIALSAGLGVWGVVNLLEGYGSDNPGAKVQEVKPRTIAHQMKEAAKLAEADRGRATPKRTTQTG